MAVAGLNIAGLEAGIQQDHELAAVKGGEAVKRPEFPTKPPPYIPTWYPQPRPVIGELG